jgi:hypothetical protein
MDVGVVVLSPFLMLGAESPLRSDYSPCTGCCCRQHCSRRSLLLHGLDWGRRIDRRRLRKFVAAERRQRRWRQWPRSLRPLDAESVAQESDDEPEVKNTVVGINILFCMVPVEKVNQREISNFLICSARGSGNTGHPGTGT